jgi:hypothetical protein
MGDYMGDLSGTVVHKRQPKSESEFHSLIVAGLARVAAKIGRGTLADKMGRTPRAIDKVFAGSIPDAKALWDATAADPSVLDEIAAAYGFRIVPLNSDPSSDLKLSAGLCDVASELMVSMQDGHRDHNETLKVADKLRHVVGPAIAIIEEADRLRGVS